MTRKTRNSIVRRRVMRRGFSLAEVVVAVALLSGVVLGFANFMQRFARSTTQASQRTTESDLAVERLEVVRAATDYAGIDAYAVREATITGYPGFVRQTYVRRTSTTTADHRTVTVVVSNAALGDSVMKTTVITAF